MAANDIVMNFIIKTEGAVAALSQLKWDLEQLGDSLEFIYDIAREGADVIGGDTLAAYERFDEVLAQVEGSGQSLVTNALLPIVEWFNFQADATDMATQALDLGLISQEQYMVATGQTNASLEVQGLALQDTADKLAENTAELAAINEAYGSYDKAIIGATTSTEEHAEAQEDLNEVFLTSSDVLSGLVVEEQSRLQTMLLTKVAMGEMTEAEAQNILALEALKSIFEGDGGVNFTFEQFLEIVSDGVVTSQELAAALNAVAGDYAVNIGISVTGDPIPTLDLTDPGTKGTKPIPQALGGPVGSGVPYMVGEFGPEMFVPNQSGTIVPTQNIDVAAPQVVVLLDGEQIGAHVLTGAGAAARMARSAGSGLAGR